EHLPQDVQPDGTLVIDNGQIKMRVVSSSATRVECEVLTPGTLGSRRHINLPGVNVRLPALTEKDRADVALGVELKVDFVALSFVRKPEDIALLRSLFGAGSGRPQIVAKIEHEMAVHHAEAIARASDALMIARGDLAIECPFQELPIIQRRLVK